MLELFYEYPRVLDRLRSGPLGGEMDGIAADLSRVGYTRGSARAYLTQVARFGRFAAKAGHEGPASIDRDIAERFLLEIESPSARATARTAIGHALRHILGGFTWARGPESSQGPDSPLLAGFDEHLRDVRGLQPSTREGMRLVGRRVLTWLRGHRSNRALSDLTGEDVLKLAGHLSTRCATGRTRSVECSYLRSFLRYLRWAGVIDEDFARLVPRTPSWRMAHLPMRLEWEDIRRVVDAIDTTSALGKRDRALLLLFATTGARSQELRLLELRDVRWRTGAILVRRTKTRRERVVPLLEEAGEALASYVLHGRPRVCASQVFLCHEPPVRPLGCSGTVAGIVRRRLAQCDLRPPRAGAHLLRHSLATRMVGQGRPIKEVADLLGHQSIDTTAIYVKVALPQLAGVALPFPGAEA
jgi:site-specific recombinase XerD